MKTWVKTSALGLIVAIIICLAARAQLNGLIQGSLTPAQDSIVQITAEAMGLDSVAFEDLPRGGTFWWVNSSGVMAPLPCPPLNRIVPIYIIADGQFLVDDTGGLVAVNTRHLSLTQATTSSLTVSAVDRLGNAVADLIEQIQQTQFERTMMMSLGVPSPGEGGGGTNGGFGGNYSTYTIDTNLLWLAITNVSNGWSYLSLHSGTNQFSTNQVFAIWTKTNLLDATWTIETVVSPTSNQTNSMPFSVQNFGREILFFRAQDWTGVDTDSDGIPDWWAWNYLGTPNVTDTNLDYSGNNYSFAYEYSNHITPTVFKYNSLEVPNNFVSSSQPTVQLNVAGTPYYIATLIDNNNFSNAVWIAYSSSTVTVNLGSVQGWHEVWIGLRGHGDETNAAVWRYKRLNLDWTPPVITITNPVNGSDVAGSYLLVQGAANEALSSLTYNVSNAAVIMTNQTGYITGQYLDSDTQLFTTNYFQLQNVPLADGVNTLTIHAVDKAGNQTVTSINYTRPASTPVFSLVWPQSGTSIMGDTFNVRGKVDNVSANISATVVDANGNTNTVHGVVEKNGKVWINQLPLGVGENTVTIATIGGTVLTNLTVERSSVTVTLNPFTSDQLNQSSVNVFGTVSDSTVQLTVNGTSATVNENGTWEADGVSVPRSGTAVLDVEVSSGITSSFMARNRMLPNDSSSAGTSGSQEFTQIQPPVVVIKSYNQDIYEEGYTINIAGRVLSGYSDAVTHWNYYAGGGYDSVQDYTPDGDYGGHFAYSQSLPAGDAALGDSSLDWIWPYWMVADVKHYITGGSDSYHDFNNQTDTRVMIRHQGQETTGSTNVYLVRAWASEVSDLLNWNQGGDIPMTPEWLKINGKTLVNSGITNENDGSVWGITSVNVPSGEDVDVTPVATQWHDPKNYTFDVQACRLFAPAVDANRDGNITFDAQDQTSATNYFRFWVNNDHDDFDTSISDYADLNPASVNDTQNLSIPCTRDLEDYSRIWVNTQGFTEELRNGTFLLALEWKGTTDDPQMQLFQSADTNGSALYLTDTNIAAQQVISYGAHIIEWSHRNILWKNNPFIFPTNFWANANVSSNQPVAHLLFDAVSRGSGQLVVSIYKNDGVTKLAEGPPLYLELQDVKEMYERYTVGSDPNSAPASTASLVTSPYSYDTSITAENKYILFVHGWNLAPWERDAFAETAFKRLYWQGYKGHFGAFQWPTTFHVPTGYPAIDDPALAAIYDPGEYNAWRSADGLMSLLTTLNSTFGNNVYLLAHSMGNIVTGEALRIAAQQGSGQIVNTYVASQAAVPGHCYDSTLSGNDLLNFAGGDLGPTTANIYNNLLATNSAAVGTRVNFYNVNDYALSSAHWQLDEEIKPDSFLGINPPYGYNGSSNDNPPLQGGFYSTFIVSPFQHTLYLGNENYVQDRYEITAFAAEPRSKALGTTANVGTFSLNVNLARTTNPRIWPPDSNNYIAHFWHSAEFLGDNARMQGYWIELLSSEAFGLK